MSKGVLAGKRGLIMGVANDKSIAWGIAQSAAREGAELAFSYQGEVLEKRVAPLAQQVGADMLTCDVTDDASIDALFKALEDKWGSLDFVVHAIGFSNKDELKGEYLGTSRENFALTMDISVYSFTAVAQRAAPLMSEGGSMVTLTYQGAVKVVPNYNVMGVAKAALEASVLYLAADFGPRGVRVNGLSAGPVRTLAASGIGDFRTMLKWNELNAPLRRNVTIQDVGDACLYLISPWSNGVTGEIHYVDGGANINGMIAMDKAGELGDLLSETAAKKG
ncbi:MAG: enoyl-[acyl-carrier-protein] reductase FabI [Geminicoccus sp.]|nr:enoyl-[acyl-carrier-protein] reductase FabI [Geminicoccus sp.]|tara:strand:- start:282 stop:1115 length:834 start_codon:yes stop_codon:yes gene_type:complete